MAKQSELVDFAECDVTNYPNTRIAAWKRFLARYRILVSRLFFAGFAALALFSEPIAYSASPVVRWSVLSAGFTCVVLAVLGRLWCSMYLCGYKTKIVVSTGPYSVVRNPLYIFSLLGALGIGIATLSITLTIIIVAFLILVSVFTVSVEEDSLQTALGDSYYRYKSVTPRFIPSWKLYTVAPQYTIATRQMHSAFTDVPWFFVVFALAAGLPTLHASGILPSLVTLP